MLSFFDLPDPLPEIILKAVPEACASHPETLLVLAYTSRWFAANLSKPSAEPMWNIAWSAAKQRQPKSTVIELRSISCTTTVKPKDKLRLAGFPWLHALWLQRHLQGVLGVKHQML